MELLEVGTRFFQAIRNVVSLFPTELDCTAELKNPKTITGLYSKQEYLDLDREAIQSPDPRFKSICALHREFIKNDDGICELTFEAPYSYVELEVFPRKTCGVKNIRVRVEKLIPLKGGTYIHQESRGMQPVPKIFFDFYSLDYAERELPVERGASVRPRSLERYFDKCNYKLDKDVPEKFELYIMLPVNMVAEFSIEVISSTTGSPYRVKNRRGGYTFTAITLTDKSECICYENANIPLGKAMMVRRIDSSMC